MATILIAEDEPAMSRGLKDNLELEGYTVSIAENGQQAINLIMANDFDLLILDIMMPLVSGLDVCRHVRKNGISVPIILLTAKGEEIDKVLGLELGADDYITKPFSLRELLARIKAILRRSSNEQTGTQTTNPNEIRVGNLLLNLNSYTAMDENGQEVKLSHKEFELVRYFEKNKGKVISRDELIKNVWNYSSELTTRTIDNFIVKIRQKIENDPNDPKVIITVHGVGYKMVIH